MPPIRALLVLSIIGLGASLLRAADVPASLDTSVFRRDNLIAWCIVPFDGKKRNSVDRAALLKQLEFKHFAYDFRAEHVPTFEQEIEACRQQGVSLDAWWFPSSMNDSARHILDVCRRQRIQPELWVTGGGAATKTPEEQQQRVAQEAARIRSIAEAAAQQGMRVGLYNHGGWFGEPENQLAIIEQLKLPNVGIIYNLHHGHDHLDRFAALLDKMKPHLLALNLNGMNRQGDKQGQKILQLGQGELDLALLKIIAQSGYRGRLGIIGHTNDDAEARLRDNLDGLDWLVRQLNGQPAGAKPQPRTPVPLKSTVSATPAPAGAPRLLAAPRDEYRTLPLTVELRARVRSATHYNILLAHEPKSSAAHWELFTMPQTGHLTVYLPGRKPDHVRSTFNLNDGQSHDVALLYEPQRVRLFVDGQSVADTVIAAPSAPPPTPATGGLAFLSLVEGNLLCDGTLDEVRLSRGLREIKPRGTAPLTADADTVGLWLFARDNPGDVLDHSPLKNPAKLVATAAAASSAQPMPPPGPHLKGVDPRWTVSLIDQSPNEVYMGVKVDQDNCVFVSGREGVFVFEPQADGRYGPRRELLRFPQDSIIMGLEFRERDLYVLTANALYRVSEGRVRRTGLQPQRILWGLPLDLHVSFHCLAWGPDGDLYLTHGDPLLQYGDWSRADHWGHWTLYCGVDEKPLPYTGQGAVLRLKHDGTDVRVVATGLRGPVGLAFDRHGNLFTNDNDHESRADRYAPAKLLHVVQGIDFGWPRGWMASKSPDRYDLVEPVCSDLGRGVPCDMLWYDHPHLGETVRERLLLCRWDRFAVTAFKLAPRGTTFVAQEETVLTGDSNARPTGIAQSRDGRLFVTNLYMTGNMAAPYCASDLVMVSRTASAAAEPTTTASTTSTTRSTALDFQDPHARQLAAHTLAQSATIDQLAQRVQSGSVTEQLLGVLAMGQRLTVPSVDYVPPESVKLFYPKESAFFKRQQRFHGRDQAIDLADQRRVGSFTTAEWWQATEHSAEQERCFELLCNATANGDDAVRLQAAYYLSLLKDPRSEPLLNSTQQDVLVRRLSQGRVMPIERVWSVGPFADGADTSLAQRHPPEQGTLDLSASYGPLAWQQQSASLPTDTSARQSTYRLFRISSGSRQAALLTLPLAEPFRVWLNGQLLGERLAGGDAPRVLLDLQPGSNDLLVRAQVVKASASWTVQALAALEIGLPEKLDSAELAQRLRAAASSATGAAVPSEFLAVDWASAALSGNAVEGRRLFGTLGCAKCHAIVAEQKGGGAPSLFEARRRFTVPHLVESLLLPSRQVAEPFRAQTIVTRDGLTLTGLVVNETSAALELVLPDTQRRTLDKKQIEQREPTQLSPMPAALVKTPDELKHLLAYILSERPTPP